MIKFLAKSAVTAIVLVLFGYFAWIYVIPKLSEHESKQKDTFLVKRVIDGDTFELENKDRVRLLGIDTPEKYESSKLDRDVERSGQDKKTIQKLGELASQFTKKLIEGKRVVLIPESNYDDKDVYGRLLRYVYLEDGTFVNKKIVEDGYAYAYRKYKISKLDEFVKCENDARVNKRGLWGEVSGLKQFDDFDTKDKKTDKQKSKKQKN
ncbi:MAG: thermonuclease family protein [Ignavibacteria bacterium]